VISAVTLSEALVVAGRRGVADEMSILLDGLGLQIVPVSEAFARRVAEAYARWGKGRHPAGLNWGDCFSYVTARDQGCPLLYVGDDFARTDLAGV
jgi:ribonuclease VapC